MASRFPLPILDHVPDELEDTPKAGTSVNPQHPEIVFGAASLSNFYNTDEHLASAVPVRTIRLALRYGIRAFDTAPYYGPSEVVLGNVLEALVSEFPRSSYQLMTKCGRYGEGNPSFDYSPATIRTSVLRSLQRLKTTYLDTVYLHDVEYVCTPVASKTTGNHVTALTSEKSSYGLQHGDERKMLGEGDQKIIDAIAELRKMKAEGLIRNIGISGYPLATLLRIAILVLHTEPYKPLDAILSYSHLTLQNSTFNMFATNFRTYAQVPQLLSASPLSNGLLTSTTPSWHPAPKELQAAVAEARKHSKDWPGQLSNLALGFAIRSAGPLHSGVPLVIGFSNPREVHECVKIWREVHEGVNDNGRMKAEEAVQKVFAACGLLDWSWSCP